MPPFFCKIEAFSPPWLKPCMILRDYWWFWRPPAPQKAGHHIYPAIACKKPDIIDFWYFTIKIILFMISCILGCRGPPEPLKYHTFSTAWGPWGQKDLHFTRMRCIQWNLVKFNSIPFNPSNLMKLHWISLNSNFAGCRGLQNHQESIGNINVFNHGGEKAPILPKRGGFN